MKAADVFYLILNSLFVCKPHLPVFSCGVDRIAENLVDCSLVLFHYQIVLLMFFSYEIVGLVMLLIGLSIHFRGPLDKEGVEVVDPVDTQEKVHIFLTDHHTL